jgi:glycerol-3-phosphate dehydrogenase
MKTREEALATIENGSFDVCVIGGGATGAGCALDAQLRGLKTVLIEGADFASGSSSASTKMAHGGVRYLETAVRGLDVREFKVVKRALRERIRMLRNAPFLTGTKRFITPCISWRGVAYYEAGLKLYDWIAGEAGLGASQFLSREEALRRIPGLNADGLVGAVAYSDGQFDDARYNIALVQTFVEAGGEALNYARVTEFGKRGDGKIESAEVEDKASGRGFVVGARAFLNATGPFADTIREMASPGLERRMRLSRGVHIVLPLEALAGGQVGDAQESQASRAQENDALLVPKTDDGRVLFAIPWMNRLLVGTTDEEVEQAEQRGVTGEEAEYLLRHLNRYLAKAVRRDEIVSGFAGVRPLVVSRRGRSARRQETKTLARDHEIEVDRASGLISVMGGKWTTYRAMAEDTINAVENELGRKATPCRTAKFPLVGSDGFGRDYWRSLVREFCISEASARHVAQKFGTRAARVLALAKEDPRLMAPLVEGLGPLAVEVAFCARYEMASSIEDILTRRIGVEPHGWREAMAAAPAVADLLGAEIGWTAEERREQLDGYVARIERLMREAGA